MYLKLQAMAGADPGVSHTLPVLWCWLCRYSNPPLHGALLVSTILHDAGLKEQWYKVGQGWQLANSHHSTRLASL